MNKYVILEMQEKKVSKLEEEKRLIGIDVRKADSAKELDDTEKRIKSLRRKRDYLLRKIKENASRENNPLVPKAKEKVAELIARLFFLLNKRKGVKND